MCNIFRKKQLLQEVFKVVSVLFCVVLVIEYNYSVLSSGLFLSEGYGQSLNRAFSVNVSKRFVSRYVRSNMTDQPPKGYLVWSDHCRMPDVDPFTPEAMKIFERKNYTSCSTEMPITKVLYDINLRTYSLHINEDAKRQLVDEDDDVSCCYQPVLRSGTGERIDKDFKLEDCLPFFEGFLLPPDIEGVIVVCDSVKLKKKVQMDAHFLVREKAEVRKRINSFGKKSEVERPVSVLMWGIDSMSRFNLRRTMPETFERLTNNSWFELSGYNKIDDNTLPNLMAVLSGYNLKTAYSRCDLANPGGLDDCNIIWEDFHKYGYVTGYAEDETWMSTFDYVVKGFKKPPVDYYHRPFMLGIEDTLPTKKQSGMTFCIGLRHAAEYIYDFALELATRFRSEPYFGLFWTNTFSHNSFEDGSSMDARISRYIEQMKELGILDDSIVIMFSDHGSRYGQLRSLKQGFLEERLPFIFIWLPVWFRSKHPNFAQALKINRYRLTNPFDLHMTLKHIIELSGRTPKLPQAVDCPNCQSLFFPVPSQRSCKDIAIDDHWCTCVPYENIDRDEKVIVDGVSSVLMHLNSYLKSGKFSPRCMNLQLKSVDEAQIKVELEPSIVATESTNNIYRIRFTVISELEAKFEASVSYSRELKKHEIIGDVSRLDAYAEGSKCISDHSAKKYCICDEKYLAKLKAVSAADGAER